jgi:hypothetical protein
VDEIGRGLIHGNIPVGVWYDLRKLNMTSVVTSQLRFRTAYAGLLSNVLVTSEWVASRSDRSTTTETFACEWAEEPAIFITEQPHFPKQPDFPILLFEEE